MFSPFLDEKIKKRREDCANNDRDMVEVAEMFTNDLGQKFAWTDHLKWCQLQTQV